MTYSLFPPADLKNIKKKPLLLSFVFMELHYVLFEKFMSTWRGCDGRSHIVNAFASVFLYSSLLHATDLITQQTAKVFMTPLEWNYMWLVLQVGLSVQYPWRYFGGTPLRSSSLWSTSRATAQTLLLAVQSQSSIVNKLAKGSHEKFCCVD